MPARTQDFVKLQKTQNYLKNDFLKVSFEEELITEQNVSRLKAPISTRTRTHEKHFKITQTKQ